MEIVPVTTLVSGKSFGVNFYKSCLIYLPYVSMTTLQTGENYCVFNVKAAIMQIT